MAIFLTPKTMKQMTTGERKLTGLLDQLDDEFLIWFNVPSPNKGKNGKPTNIRYPDFLIFHPDYGLLCLEVKDWSVKNISKISKEEILIKKDGEIMAYTHPLIQARECLFPFINKMQNDKQLCNKKGRLKFAYGYGCVLTNLSPSDIPDEYQKIFMEIFPEKQIFFSSDLTQMSIEHLKGFLYDLFPYHADKKLTVNEINRLRAHIFPELIINVDEVHNKEGELDFNKNFKVMDYQQEQLARNLKSGHRIIHGVAGSGKTMILQHRALSLVDNLTEQDLPILVICFNKTLANTLKSRLNQSKIEVHHFHEWCEQIKKKYHLNIFSNNLPYYETLPITVCNYIINNHQELEKYSAILIDEGHDLDANWLRSLALMTDEQKNLLLLYDDAQNIYQKNKGIGFSLTSVGIEARGRTQILKINYRNSREIQEFSKRFLNHFIQSKDLNSNEDNIPTLDSQSNGYYFGHHPELLQFQSLNDEYNWIGNKIIEWQQSGVDLEQIAVLVYNKKNLDDLSHFLQKKQIPLANLTVVQKVNQQISLSTIHSSKGLEFKKVIVANLGRIWLPNQVSVEEMARVIYIGLTRAQEELYLTTTPTSEIRNQHILQSILQSLHK